MILLSLLTSCNQQKVQFQGYIEGDFTYISPNFVGVVESLKVKRGQLVQAGDPLFVLEQQPESDDYKAALASVTQAQAQIDQTKANLTLAEITYQRQSGLFKNDATPKQDLDQARANLLQNQATLIANQDALQVAQANLEKAQWTVGKKTMSAPISGIVFDTFFYPGELAQAGQPILVLLAQNMIYAVFYVPETQLAKIRVNQQVEIKCDGCDQPLAAKITYISPQVEYTPPVIFSNETNYKLVYRVEAYPDPSNGYKLHPGQPVQIAVNLNSKSSTEENQSPMRGKNSVPSSSIIVPRVVKPS